MSDKKIMQTYVYYEDKAFFISTMERDYSSMAGTVRGEETLVWEIDVDSKVRGDLLYHLGGVMDHLNVSKQLARTGKYEEVSDE